MARFAQELRELRQRAGGPPYRVMAQQSDYSITALSQAAAGEQLPSLDVTLAYVKACGADVGQWEQRWRDARSEADHVLVEPEDASDAPYHGLARFEPGDSGRFFGRTRLTEDLVELARTHRITVVLGPSGSGKSSLLRAGLVPRLQSTSAFVPRPAAIRILTPGPCPARQASHSGAPTRS
ncbi:helix-turn-helix domain-containing protein [Streptomyces sp. NPDC059063]|uniref:helix-turn-helix domain-containing protein n=1 Tax=Streptomyces sp. NPDC059063 TaxID=3346712 RepID=UPI0036C4A5A3